MTPGGPARPEQMRLATLLEIGRSLSGATEVADVRQSVTTGLSKLFPAHLLFCSEIVAGEARIVVVAQDGVLKRTRQPYEPVATENTPDDGCALDAEAAADLASALSRPGTSAAMVLPIRASGQLVGEIGALRSAAEPFTDADCALLGFGSAMIAAAITQRDRFQETEARRREAERLEQIGRAITSSLDLEEVLERVLQAAIDLTDADSCTIWSRHDAHTTVIASRGRDALPVGFSMEVPPHMREELDRRRRVVQIDDVAADTRLPAPIRAAFSGSGPRAAILVPMICHEVVVGVLSVGHHEPRRYDAEALAILQRLALQAAIAIENAQLHAEIRDLSLTDPLTGLPNRRHLHLVLDKEFEAARRGRPLTVVLFDLDDFKRFNDAHGHAGGDTALCDFGEILSGLTRAMNLTVRYGGDEFLTILSESTADGAAHLVERIEQKVREHPHLRELGFSAGIAQYSREMQTPDALIAAADAAMYRNKLEPRPAR